MIGRLASVPEDWVRPRTDWRKSLNRMVHLKRSILLLAAILAIQFLQPDGLFAANRKVKAKPKPKAKAGLTAISALVMNMTTGEILYSKNPDESIAPASLTKILSLYLIYEALGEGRVRTSDIVHVSSTVSQVNGSRMRIRPGCADRAGGPDEGNGRHVGQRRLCRGSRIPRRRRGRIRQDE